MKSRVVQVDIDDVSELCVEYDSKRNRSWHSDIEVPEELIYALTDAQEKVSEALDELNDWAKEQGFEDFYSMVQTKNDEKYQEYQRQLRAEQAKRRKPSIARGVTVVDR